MNQTTTSASALVFSIKAGPPSAVALAAEQRRIDAERVEVARALRRHKVLALAAQGTLFAVVAIPVVTAVTALGSEAAVAAAVTALAVGAWFSGVVGLAAWLGGRHQRLLDRRSALDADAARLELLPTHRCPQVLEWCREHPPLAAYQAQAAAERLLVNGDHEAMSWWLGASEQRQAEVEQQAACSALRAPLVPSVQPS